GHRKSSTGLGRTAEARGQSVQRFRGRARRGYRKAQVVLAVHSARRNGLRRDASASARRTTLTRQIRTKPASQVHALGQPQWADVCAGSNQRAVSDGQAVCESELDGRVRRQGAAEASTGHGAFEGRDVDYADCERWDKLVS